MRVHDQSVVSGGDNQGAVWYAMPVEVAGGFETTFEFSINGVGSGDGMAFVIQNDTVARYDGMTGANGIDQAESGALGVDRDSGAAHTLRVLYVPGRLDVFLNGTPVISVPWIFDSGSTTGSFCDPANPNSTGGSISAGSTRYFQLWHRDTNPGTVTNLSNGISVIFWLSSQRRVQRLERPPEPDFIRRVLSAAGYLEVGHAAEFTHLCHVLGEGSAKTPVLVL